MNYEKYLIKKGKLDLLSSLNALDKKLLNKALKNSEMNSIEELKDGILEEFEMSLDMSKDDLRDWLTMKIQNGCRLINKTLKIF